jgi:biotin synthase
LSSSATSAARTATTGGELGITLSLGEQTEDVYRAWFDAGAHRYLLRVETTNRELYRALHPVTHDFDARIECLQRLRRVGYQVGTGVMIGLPGQTTEDLANDIAFFRDHDIDMIGMGPYVLHSDTPLADVLDSIDPETQLELGLKMIAVTRLVLRDVNIAATTALQALNPVGREMGLQAGANIIMPNLTDTQYRESYQLYEGKPCMDEDSSMCRGCLQRRVAGIGETIGLPRHPYGPCG